MANENCIIFPHIPKCGGTSLKKQFEESDLNVFYDYEFPPHNSHQYFNSLCERRNRESALLNFENFDLVFGHFPVERYQRRNYQYVTLMRHPLERALSHYFYWKNIPSSNKVAILREPIIQNIKDGSVTFHDFIRDKKIARFYRSYLGQFRSSDFMLVGFHDNYDSFLQRLSESLGTRLESTVHERKGKKESISDEDIHKAVKILEPEIERYEAFKKYW